MAVQHANNRDQFKSDRFNRHPGPAISTLTACLAAVGLSEIGTNVFSCVGNREMQRKRQKESTGGEKRRGQRERERLMGQEGEMWWQHVSF